MHQKTSWDLIVRRLLDAGMSQARLAEQAGVDQSTICRLADGRAPEPRHSVGERLVALAGGREALRAIGISVAEPALLSPVSREGEQHIQEAGHAL